MSTPAYTPAALPTETRWQGDTTSISYTVGAGFSLTAKVIRYQIRDHDDNLVLGLVSPTNIDITDQQIDINLLSTDTVLVPGTYTVEMQAEYTGGPTTMGYGTLIITKDRCYV